MMQSQINKLIIKMYKYMFDELFGKGRDTSSELIE